MNSDSNADEVEKERTFSASQVAVGGICPFVIKSKVERELLPTATNSNVKREQLLQALRSEAFEPTRDLADVGSLRYIPFSVQHLALPSGTVFEDLQGYCVVALWPENIGSLTVWLEFGDAKLTAVDLVFLATTLRERQEASEKKLSPGVMLRHGGGSIYLENLFEIFGEILADQHGSLDSPQGEILKSSSFVYPLVYVGELDDVEDAAELVSTYGRTISQIANLWIQDVGLVKQSGTTSKALHDTHPFLYGSTFISSTCGLELHPRNIRRVACDQGRPVADHHFRERCFLQFVCEVPVAQYFSVRMYDVRLTEILRQVDETNFGLIDIIAFFKIFFFARRLLSLRNTVTRDVLQFRYFYTSKRRYVSRIMRDLADDLGTFSSIASVDKKLSTIDGIVQSTFSMLTTTLALILAALAAFFAVIQIFTALAGA